MIELSVRRVPKARRGGSREAIVEAAQRLFLERGFGSVSMDELAEAAGVARRTLYNQFARKEDIFREMLLKVSRPARGRFPDRHRNQRRCGGCAAPDRTDHPGATQEPGISRVPPHGRGRQPAVSLDCRGIRGRHGPSDRAAHPLLHPSERRWVSWIAAIPTLAAHQFMGMLNEFSLWPWMMGRESDIRVAQGRGRRNDPDVPVALPAATARAQRSRRDGVIQGLVLWLLALQGSRPLGISGMAALE